MAKILPCTCKSEFQDKLYGNGNRVHNMRAKERKLVGWRCTVCGNKKDATSSEKSAMETKKKEERENKKQ